MNNSKSKTKYVAIRQYYPNCPVHDGSGYPELQFFKSIKDYALAVVSRLNTYDYSALHDFNDRIVCSNIPQAEGHKFRSVDFELFKKNKKI